MRTRARAYTHTQLRVCLRVLPEVFVAQTRLGVLKDVAKQSAHQCGMLKRGAWEVKGAEIREREKQVRVNKQSAHFHQSQKNYLPAFPRFHITDRILDCGDRLAQHGLTQLLRACIETFFHRKADASLDAVVRTPCSGTPQSVLTNTPLGHVVGYDKVCSADVDSYARSTRAENCVKYHCSD